MPKAHRPGISSVQTHNGLGIQHAQAHRLVEAERCFRQALALQPDFAPALENLATLLVMNGRAAEAMPIFTRRRALGRLSPTMMLNYSTALTAHGRLAEAERMLRNSEAANPSGSTASNLGNLLRQLGRIDDAIHWLNRAVERSPQVAEYHYNRALTLLLAGRYRDGWSDYEWRRRKTWTSLATRNYSVPLWDGKPLEGTLFIYPEQGLGDTLQFIRFLSETKKHAHSVAFECPPRQQRLFASFASENSIVLCDGPSAVFAAHTGLMSLPYLLGLELDDIAQHSEPYLHPEPGLVDTWRARLESDKLNIGIAWQGSPDYPRDAERSIPLQYFAPIANVPGVRLISLQKGYGTEQIAHFGVPIVELGSDVDLQDAFVDTAAILASLDLIITSDTSVAHLAGSLGITTWLLLPFVPDWRWLMDRQDSPWYPSLRLFRQEEPEDWSGVFERVVTALVQHTAKQK